MFFTLLILSLVSTEIHSVEEFICESSNLNIECPSDTIIHIDNAVYGRHNSTICPKKDLDQNVNCSSTNATQILQQRCDGKDNCSFLVSNEIFSDPCVGTYKYLELNYSCEPILRPPHFPPWRPFPTHFCGRNGVARCRPCLYGRQCPAICIIECVCETGYIKDSKTGRCVAKAHAPQPGTECETHEVFSECGAGCQKTCTNQNPICTFQCVSGYVCAENYVRNSSNQCVLPANCPVVKQTLPPVNCSGPDEDYRCVDPCYREFCNSSAPPPSCRIEPICEDRCVCQTGYIRDPATRRCISPQYCPLPGPESETHETFSECGAGCQATCANKNEACNRLCIPGYICESGYLRNSTTTRQCIRPNQCPA